MSWLAVIVVSVGMFSLGYCLGRGDLLDREWQDCMWEEEE